MDIQKIIKSKTFTQSALASSAALITAIFGILFYMFLARQLGPADFGILSISITTLTLLADIANVGTDTGIVRFVGKHINTQKEKALRFLKLGLKVKVIAGIIIALLGWILIPFITSSLLNKPQLTGALQLSAIGCISILLFSFVTSSIRATQKFLSWSILSITINFLRLMTIPVFASIGALTLSAALSSYIAIPLLGFFLGLLILPRFLSVKNENAVAKEFFHYNKWVAIFIVIAALSSRLDAYLGARLLSLEEVGIYSVATGLAAIVPQIISAIATVVAPKLSSFSTRQQAIKYLKKLQIFVIALALLGIGVAALLAQVVIPAFYGTQYSASALPFIILIIAQAVFLISIPAHTSVIYYFSYTKLFVPVSLGHLIITLILGWSLISSMGYIGASITVLIGNIFNFLVPSIWVVYRFRKK